MFDMLNMLNIFKVYFENGLRKETEILVKTNFGSFIFILLLKKNVASGYTLWYSNVFPSKKSKKRFFS